MCDRGGVRKDGGVENAIISVCLYRAFNPLALRALSLSAREDCATKDFLSLPKKVLVTLICVICSFFSTARRTNQEVPPLLSGFWVRRYGRRRGLRNSLRSDSPRPFSSVFLATSPPDKGGDFARAFAGLFNPLARWALPLYSLTETQGERDMHHSVLVIEGISPTPLPCPVASRDIALKSK